MPCREVRDRTNRVIAENLTPQSGAHSDTRRPQVLWAIASALTRLCRVRPQHLQHSRRRTRLPDRRYDDPNPVTGEGTLQSISQESLEMRARHDVVVRAFALEHVECGLRPGDPCRQPLTVAGHHLTAGRCGPGGQHRPDIRESEARLLRDHRSPPPGAGPRRCSGDGHPRGPVSAVLPPPNIAARVSATRTEPPPRRSTSCRH